MIPGNANYNMLFNPKEKHYISYSNSIDASNDNSSHSIVVNAVEENSKVLDVGCSFGYIGEWLVKNKNCTLYGIDIDSKAVSFINSVGVYEGAEYINLDKVLDSSSEDYKAFQNIDNDFDYIICADLLEHLLDPTAIVRLLGSKLKMGGKILVSIPNIANIDILINLLEGRFNYSDFGILDNTHVKFFTLKSFIEWIYSININHKDYIFDLDHLGATKVIPVYTQEIKKQYSLLIDSLISINPELENLQNIFCLTKLEKKKEKKTNLLKLLMSYRRDYKVDTINDVPVRISEIISPESVYEYKLKAQYNHFCGIEFLPATFTQALNGRLILEIMDEGKEVPFVVKNTDLSLLKDNSWMKVYFNIIENSRNKSFKIRLRIKDTDQNLAVWVNDYNIPCIKLLFINDDFNIENSIEEHHIIEKLEKNLKGCLLSDGDGKGSVLSDNEEINKLRDENKRLKNLVKDLLDEIV